MILFKMIFAKLAKNLGNTMQVLFDCHHAFNCQMSAVIIPIDVVPQGTYYLPVSSRVSIIITCGS